MCWTHPDTGGEMLYVNPNFGRYVEGNDGRPIDGVESELLLEQLYAQVWRAAGLYLRQGIAFT